MHIVLDARSIHQHMAGIGRAALHLSEQLGRRHRGHRVTVLVGDQPQEALTIRGVELVQLEAAMIDEPFEQLGLPAVLEDLHAEVYVNTTFSVPALKTTLFQVAVIHDVVFEDHPEWVEPGLRAYLQRWSRFAAAHADRVVTVSDHARERICAVYRIDKSRVVCIHNGMPPSAFAPPVPDTVDSTRQKYSLHAPYILYLGSVETKKGTPELLDAFANLAGVPGRHGPLPLLVMAGGKSGSVFDLDQAIDRTGLKNRIRHIGYVSETEKKALIAGCALFVYPSRYEGFGLPPLEAMALGIPCVVNDATSIPEIVGDAAVKVNVCDRDAFARAIHEGLHNDAFRARVKVAGPERARTFTWERAADQLLDLCESLTRTAAQ